MNKTKFLYINFLKNNIIITLVDRYEFRGNYKYNTLKTISPSMFNFKHKQKKTPFSCIFSLKKILTKEPLNIIFKGESFFRQLIIYLLKKENILILSIHEKTSIPHNGCKLYSYKKLKKINEQ